MDFANERIAPIFISIVPTSLFHENTVTIRVATIKASIGDFFGAEWNLPLRSVPEVMTSSSSLFASSTNPMIPTELEMIRNVKKMLKLGLKIGKNLYRWTEGSKGGGGLCCQLAINLLH